MLTYKQFRGPEAYGLDPAHVVAVVRERDSSGDTAHVLIRTSDGRAYVIEGEFDAVVTQINKTF